MVTVCPAAASTAVLIHQLTVRRTQAPFRKSHGRVAAAAFHPSKPFLFVATASHVRVYNLVKQALVKKLSHGPIISALAVHPTGDHVLVGGNDRKLAWFDLDLSTRPYKQLASHTAGVTSVAYHGRRPLFASASQDGTAHVFHGMVYADLLQNPLIVPLRVLRGHGVKEQEGVLALAWHPTQPWLLTAGADGTARLYCN